MAYKPRLTSAQTRAVQMGRRRAVILMLMSKSRTSQGQPAHTEPR